jgi:hypothetical protein
MASASGTRVPAIARLVAADEGTVRDVVQAFNEKVLAALDPKWEGGQIQPWHFVSRRQDGAQLQLCVPQITTT